MSYRDLRQAEADGAPCLFAAAQRYAAYLLRQRQPARAILALCRALYIDPDRLGSDHRQPYAAYVWILQNGSSAGFLGNPRISFHHQACRIHPAYRLKRYRAWALWHLTRQTLPHLPPDPRSAESPPEAAAVAEFLDRKGLPGEGQQFREVLEGASGIRAVPI